MKLKLNYFIGHLKMVGTPLLIFIAAVTAKVQQYQLFSVKMACYAVDLLLYHGKKITRRDLTQNASYFP